MGNFDIGDRIDMLSEAGLFDIIATDTEERDNDAPHPADLVLQAYQHELTALLFLAELSEDEVYGPDGLLQKFCDRRLQILRSRMPSSAAHTYTRSLLDVHITTLQRALRGTLAGEEDIKETEADVPAFLDPLFKQEVVRELHLLGTAYTALITRSKRPSEFEPLEQLKATYETFFGRLLRYLHTLQVNKFLVESSHLSSVITAVDILEAEIQAMSAMKPMGFKSDGQTGRRHRLYDKVTRPLRDIKNS